MSSAITHSPAGLLQSGRERRGEEGQAGRMMTEMNLMDWNSQTNEWSLRAA
jgi:hypothetical protein